MIASIAGLLMLQNAIAAVDDLDKVRVEVLKNLPGSKVVNVHATPMTGIYEVTLSPPQILYTDAHARYILAGASLLDMNNQVNLTEQRMAELTRVSFSSLPLNQSIKTVKGNGTLKIAMFSDPDCPYCKKLERETLNRINNVTIYTFLYPLDQHTDAAHKSNMIWCAPDKAKAWEDWMQRGKLPAEVSTCTAPLAANMALAAKLGVRATPTMITEKGELVMGALPLDALEVKLAN